MWKISFRVLPEEDQIHRFQKQNHSVALVFPLVAVLYVFYGSMVFEIMCVTVP